MTAAPAYAAANGSQVNCTLCHHHCKLADGETGRCGIRRNTGGNLELPYFGALSALANDPIEKKPLYHFHPGEMILSAGFVGCNLSCPFCQNYSISQSTSRANQHTSPSELVDEALRQKSFAIAYTYNEPSIHFEYVSAAALAARSSGLKNVMVTNGSLNAKPAREILELMDAVNVDLKSFNPDFYRDELGGSLATTRRFITIAHELCHVEVTTLLIPGRNDSPEEITAIAKFISELSPDIPLHISAYYPTYKYNVRATTQAEVQTAVSTARQHLRHVYAGNIPGSQDTQCGTCGHTLVVRAGYRVTLPGLSGSQCANCGAASPIVIA